MKYKVGDKVQVRKNLVPGLCGKVSFLENMKKYEGEILTIEEVCSVSYIVKENFYYWTDEMLEPVNKKIIGYRIIKNFPTIDIRFKKGFFIDATLDNPKGWRVTVRMAANFPEFWEPVYEEDFSVTIKGYKSEIRDKTVTFGCRTFSHEFIIELADTLEENDLDMDYKDEIIKLGEYLKNL